MSSRESDTDCTTNTDTEEYDEDKSRCSTCYSESGQDDDEEEAVFYEDLMSSNDSGSETEKINSAGEPAIPSAAPAGAGAVATATSASVSDKKRIRKRTDPDAVAKVSKTSSLPTDPLAPTRQLLETLVQELVTARQSASSKPPIAKPIKPVPQQQQQQQQQPTAGGNGSSSSSSSKAKRDLVTRLQTLGKNFEAAHQRLRDLQKL